MTILVVDDSSIIVDLFCEFLTNQGYTVTGVYSFSDAKKILEMVVPRLIIADDNIHGKNGIELRNETNNNVPFILMETNYKNGGKYEYKKDGNYWVIYHPLGLRDMMNLVNLIFNS